MASATVTPASIRRAGVRVGRAGRELHAGQQPGHHAGVGEGGDVRVVEVGAVVGRGGADLGRDLDAGTGAELVRMDARPQPRGHAGREHRPRLVGAERAVLAEHVDPAGVRRAGLEHRAGDEVDVGRRRSAPPGHHVGAEERRLLGGLPRDRERAGLVADGEAVAALDLDGRGALRPHLGDVPGDVGGELLVGRRAGGRDRGADAAGLVRSPGHPGLELRRAVAGEDEVRVGVDEAGDHRGAADVAHGVGVRCAACGRRTR